MRSVFIQYQESGRPWQTASTLSEDASGGNRIINEMKSVQNGRPNARIRTVDEDGRILDIL